MWVRDALAFGDETQFRSYLDGWISLHAIRDQDSCNHTPQISDFVMAMAAETGSNTLPFIYDVIIVGAGPCGLAVAARLRERTPSALFTDDSIPYMYVSSTIEILRGVSTCNVIIHVA